MKLRPTGGGGGNAREAQPGGLRRASLGCNFFAAKRAAREFGECLAARYRRGIKRHKIMQNSSAACGSGGLEHTGRKSSRANEKFSRPNGLFIKM